MNEHDRFLMTLKDPERLVDGRPVPLLTTLLYDVCSNDVAKFQTACRLIGIALTEASRK